MYGEVISYAHSNERGAGQGAVGTAGGDNETGYAAKPDSVPI